MPVPQRQNRSIEKPEKFGTPTPSVAAAYGGEAVCSARLPDVRVSVGDFLTPLLAAVRENRCWVDDFQNDLITIPADLYEIIRESARLRLESSTMQD